MKIDFSIIIPIADDAPEIKLFRCLKHLSQQIYPPKEIIIITGTDFSKRLVNRVKLSDRKIKVFQINLNKAEARNFGCKKATTNYVVNIDVDNYLDPDALISAYEIIKRHRAKATIVHEKVKPTNLISRIRCLEKKLCFYDPVGATPQVVEKKLFDKIGGFDESSPILDEYTLRYKLKKQDIKFYEIEPKISVDVYTDLKTILRRKFIRGRAYMQLKKGYPESKKIFSFKRFSSFTKNIKIYFEDPVASVLYFVFKPIEWFIFILGVISPVYTKPYELESVAKTYDKIRENTNFRIYKNYSEYKLLDRILSDDIKTVLEIGAGTGRITRFMVDKGLKVTAYDPSDAMIAEYRKKPGLPAIRKASGENLKEKPNGFDCALGIRVIWHIKNGFIHSKIIHNLARSSKKYVILDFATAEKYKNPFLNPLFVVYSLFNNHFFKNDYFFTFEEIVSKARKAGLTIDTLYPLDLLTPIWLNLLPRKSAKKLFPYLLELEIKLARAIPPGRWLIRFVKNNQI